MIPFSPLQVLAIAAGTWVAWRILSLVYKTPGFPDIPGPPPDSIVDGEIFQWVYFYLCAYSVAREYVQTFRPGCAAISFWPGEDLYILRFPSSFAQIDGIEVDGRVFGIYAFLNLRPDLNILCKTLF